MQSISGRLPILPVEPLRVEAASTVNAGFASELGQAIDRVEGYRRDADQQIRSFLNGGGEDLHKVALATQEAELSLELFQQIRNKAVQAYQEVMRMQL